MLDQMQDPANVYTINFKGLIFSSPAGIEISSLTNGTTLPRNTALSPYLSNQISTRSNFFSDTLIYFQVTKQDNSSKFQRESNNLPKVPIVAPADASTIMGITPAKVIPCWDAKNPATGNTANVGMGVITVSIKAAKKMPS